MSKNIIYNTLTESSENFILSKHDNSLMELFNGINLIKRLMPQYINEIVNPNEILYDENTRGSLVTSIINGMTKKIHKAIDNMAQNDNYKEFLILKMRRLEILYKTDQYCKLINNIKYNHENMVNFMNEMGDINKKINNYDFNNQYIKKNNSLKKLINYILKEEQELENITELIDNMEMNISTVKLLKLYKCYNILPKGYDNKFCIIRIGRTRGQFPALPYK